MIPPSASLVESFDLNYCFVCNFESSAILGEIMRCAAEFFEICPEFLTRGLKHTRRDTRKTTTQIFIFYFAELRPIQYPWGCLIWPYLIEKKKTLGRF